MLHGLLCAKMFKLHMCQAMARMEGSSHVKTTVGPSIDTTHNLDKRSLLLKESRGSEQHRPTCLRTTLRPPDGIEVAAWPMSLIVLSKSGAQQSGFMIEPKLF